MVVMEVMTVMFLVVGGGQAIQCDAEQYRSMQVGRQLVEKLVSSRIG